MNRKKLSLSKLLKSKKNFPSESDAVADKAIKQLQLKLLRVQEGVWHNKKHVLILFEGQDAAGKGGTIKRIVENLDPRSVHVYPYGPPSPEEQGRNYLYRFWLNLPLPGNIAIFDRTWYGRVLVERVKELIPAKRWKEAYAEINNLEKMLTDDGVDLVKIYLAITPDEQLKRFEQRLKDPYKQFKLTPDDIQAHEQWNDYVEAADEMLKRTNTPYAPWHLIPANDKDYARTRTLQIVTSYLKHHHDWMEKRVNEREVKELQKALRNLKRMD